MPKEPKIKVRPKGKLTAQQRRKVKTKMRTGLIVMMMRKDKKSTAQLPKTKKVNKKRARPNPEQ